MKGIPRAERLTMILAYIVVSVNLIVTLIELLPGWESRLQNKWAWLIVVCLLLLAAHAVIRRERLGACAGIPALYAASAFLLLRGSWDLGIAEYGLIMIDLVLAIALPFRCERKLLKLLTGILSAVPIVILVFFFFGSLVFHSFGTITMLEFPSPQGQYIAEITISDEGALGGSTNVTIYQPEKSFDLFFMLLRRTEGTANLPWCAPENIDLRWIDEKTCSVNGAEFQLP